MKLKHLLFVITCMAAMPLMAILNEEVDSLNLEVVEIDVAVDSISSISESLPGEVMADAIETISGRYPENWNELSMQGKLNFEGLPVRPTVKIYMKRGESILMSARAPIVGEVARVEICKDSITIINKHSKKYWSQNLIGRLRGNSDVVSDLQDILLGYVAFPGVGRMRAEVAPFLRWIISPDNDIFLYPADSMQFEGAEYGFVINPENYDMDHFLLLLPNADTVVQTSYLYGDVGWTLGLEVQTERGSIGGDLQLSYPDYSPSALDFTNAGQRYTCSDLKGLLKF